MKWLNNKVLIIVLLVLVAVFVLTKVVRTPSLNRNVDTDVLRMDTSRITELKLYVKNNQESEIRFTKKSNEWIVSQNNKKARVKESAFENLLNSLAALKVQRIVSRKKDKWASYDLNDSSATRLVAFRNDELLSELWFGKEASGSTYVRKEGEDEVYLVAEHLTSQLNKKFNEWRDPSFLQMKEKDITGIKFDYPADSSFSIAKVEGKWKAGNESVDSVQVMNYLSRFSSEELTEFYDSIPTGKPDAVITFEKGDSALSTVRGWKQSFDRWILNSNLQDSVYFLDEGPRIASELFPSQKQFVKK